LAERLLIRLSQAAHRKLPAGTSNQKRREGLDSAVPLKKKKLTALAVLNMANTGGAKRSGKCKHAGNRRDSGWLVLVSAYAHALLQAMP
jgi:hypothetical protein